MVLDGGGGRGLVRRASAPPSPSKLLLLLLLLTPLWVLPVSVPGLPVAGAGGFCDAATSLGVGIKVFRYLVSGIKISFVREQKCNWSAREASISVFMQENGEGEEREEETRQRRTSK